MTTTPFPGGRALCVEHIFPQGETVSQMVMDNARSMTYASPAPNHLAVFEGVFRIYVIFCQKACAPWPSSRPVESTAWASQDSSVPPLERHRRSREHRGTEPCSLSSAGRSPRPHRSGLKEHKGQIRTSGPLHCRFQAISKEGAWALPGPLCPLL